MRKGEETEWEKENGKLKKNHGIGKEQSRERLMTHSFRNSDILYLNFHVI